MKLDVLNINGGSTGRSIELPKDIFGVTPHEHSIYLAVKQYLAAQRQGTHKAKEKSEVWRTTKKFKRQKGTGGARAGSLKSPIFKGGGTIFGPRPRNYDICLNKRVKSLAKYSALAFKAQQGAIKIVEDFSFDAPKTKSFVEVADNVGFGYKSLVVLPDYDSNVYLSGRNLPGTHIVCVNDLNTYDVMNAKTIVFLESSVSKVK